MGLSKLQDDFEGRSPLRRGSSDYWAASDGLVEGVWTAEMVVPDAELTEYTQPYVQSYEAAYGNVPGLMGPIVYDAVRLYADAVREVGSTDPEDLIPYLEEMTWRRSISLEEYRFHGPDDEFAHDMEPPCILPETCDDPAGIPLLAQWQEAEEGNGGVQKVFAPEMHETAAFQAPPWQR